MKSDGAPLVSVILPVRECRHLEKALQSIMNQSFQQIEVVVILHRATKYCRNAAKHLGKHDARIRYLSLESGNLSAALDFGIRESSAPLIARMDADDIAHEQRIALQFLRFKQGDIDVCGTNVVTLNETGAAFGKVVYPEKDDEIRRVLGLRNPIAHPSVLFSREAYEVAGGYRRAIRLAQDYDLWIRMAEAGLSFYNLQEPLLEYRSPQLHLSRSDGLWAKFNVLASAALRQFLERDLFDECPELWDAFSFHLLTEFSNELHPVCMEVERRLKAASTYSDVQAAVSLAIASLPSLNFGRESAT